MTIEQFAQTFSVNVRRDSCGESIIPGKPRKEKRPEDRSHIFLYSEDEKTFGVLLTFSTARRWNSVRERLVAAGFTLGQKGDREGTLLFDPTDSRQANAAIREAGIRVTTEAMRNRGRNSALVRRTTPIAEGFVF